MPLPCPGPDQISLLDIQNVFDGGVSPIGINEYYRNGAYVFTNIDGTTDNIPTSGQISFADFFCGNGEIVYPITKDTANVDVSLLFGNWWTSLRPKRLIVMPGVRVYNTNPYAISNLNGYAMIIYDTFSGKLTIENRGSIEGAAGRRGGDTIIAGESRTNQSNGGQGGNAVYIGPKVFLLNFNRYYNGQQHYYGETPPTTGYTLEASNYFNVFQTQATSTIALRRLSNFVNGAKLLTISSSEYNRLSSKIVLVGVVPAGTTTITGLNYIPGAIYYVDVNGVAVTNYTANDGTSIVFSSPLPGYSTNSRSTSVTIFQSVSWTGQGVVGYVYSSSAPGRVPIYRSKNSSGSDYLFSTSSTEGPNSGYTSEGIAFYAPPATGLAVIPKPTIYVNNQGTIYAAGGGGGYGTLPNSTSGSFPYGNYDTGSLGQSFGGYGQGYNQSNTIGTSAIAIFDNITINATANSSQSFNVTIPPYTQFITYNGGAGNYNTAYVYIGGFCGNVTINFGAGSNGTVYLYLSPIITTIVINGGAGNYNTAYVYGDPTSVGKIIVNQGAGTGFSYNPIGGGGDYSNNGHLTGTNNGQSFDIAPQSPGGKGGDGGTWGNSGTAGSGSGSPGGSSGYAIVNASQYVSYVTQGTIAGQTT